MTNNDRRIPAAVYAVAGASELAYRQLRRLPTTLRDELPPRVELLRAEAERRVPAAVYSLLAEGRRVYDELVARGEKALARSRREAATTVAPPGDVVTRPAGRSRDTARPARRRTTRATESRTSRG